MRMLAVVRGSCAISAYALIPFLSIWLATKGDDRTSAFLVAAFIFCYRGGAIFLSPLVAVWGGRLSIVCFLTTGVCSLAALFWSGFQGQTAQTTFLAVAGASLSAVILALKVAGSEQPTKELQLKAFSMLSVGANAGAALGPFLTGWLILYSSDSLGYVVCAPLLIALACLIFVANPNSPRAQLPVPASVTATAAQATDFRLIISLVVSAVFTWIGFSQVFAVLPAALNQYGQTWSVPFLFAANSGLVILLQIPVSRCVSAGETRLGLRPFSILILANGIFMSSFGVLSLGFGQSVTFAFLAIALFTLGELIWDPLFERLTATNCSPNAKPSILAVISVVRGIAEATGAALGLVLVAADSVHPGAFLLGAAVCLTATVPLMLERLRVLSRQSLPRERDRPPVCAGVGLSGLPGTSTRETDPA